MARTPLALRGPHGRRLSCPHGVLGWGPQAADTLASLELPEKQEQLAAIYAVLEHLPEANHNSLERLIFHLVKQVPALLSVGLGSLSGAPTTHSQAVSSAGSAPAHGPTLRGLGGFPGRPLTAALCRVALLEDVNRMSPSALAIIFAPCLLRCPDNSDPLTSMKDVLKITT